MAEVSVDERRLLKTMRWYDGFVIGLRTGVFIVGIGFSVGALGAKVAAILWFVSALWARFRPTYSESVRCSRTSRAASPWPPGKAGASTSLAGSIATFRLLVRLVERAGNLRRADRSCWWRVLHQLELQGVNTDSIGS